LLAAYDIFSPTTGAVKLTLPAVADMAFVRGTAQAYERTLAFLAFRQAKVEMGLTRSLGIAKGLDRVTISQGVPRSCCPAFRRELMEFFIPEIVKIGKLTGRDFFVG